MLDHVFMGFGIITITDIIGKWKPKTFDMNSYIISIRRYDLLGILSIEVLYDS